MGRIMHESIDLSALGSDTASATLDAILRLDAEIFEYADPATRARYYDATRAPAERRVAIVYRESGSLIGYNLITLSTLEVEDRRWSVVTSNAGFHPKHVGKSRTMPDAFALMTRWMLREPARQWMFVSYIVNPAAYDLLVDVNPVIAPSPAHPRLESTQRTLIRLTAERSGHTIARDDDAGLTIMLRRPKLRFRPRAMTPAMEFHRTRCPDFARGEALGICGAITPSAVVTGLMRHSHRWWRRRHGARLNALDAIGR